MKLTALITIFVLVFGSARAGEFHDQVTALYSFSPHKLTTDSELDAKSEQLDIFWTETKARGEEGLKDLRIELARSDISPFFAYDGAKLLLSLSTSREDCALALKAIERTDPGVRGLHRPALSDPKPRNEPALSLVADAGVVLSGQGRAAAIRRDERLRAEESA